MTGRGNIPKFVDELIRIMRDHYSSGRRIDIERSGLRVTARLLLQSLDKKHVDLVKRINQDLPLLNTLGEINIFKYRTTSGGYIQLTVASVIKHLAIDINSKNSDIQLELNELMDTWYGKTSWEKVTRNGLRETLKRLLLSGEMSSDLLRYINNLDTEGKTMEMFDMMCLMKYKTTTGKIIEVTIGSIIRQMTLEHETIKCMMPSINGPGHRINLRVYVSIRAFKHSLPKCREGNVMPSYD